MVLEHIQKLLFTHDCVIVPDFGGLITHYEPVRINPVRHSFLPPAKRIAFNEQLKINDGLLISTLAYDKNLSSEEAQRRIAQFVLTLQQELNVNRRFDFKGIGVFRLNAENKINFEYLENENFLDDAFGLPELISKPVIPEPALLRTLLKEQASPAQKGFRGTVRKYYRAVAALTVMGVAFTGLYFLSLQKDYNVSAINPVTLFQADKQDHFAPEESVPATGEYSTYEYGGSEEIMTEPVIESSWQEDPAGSGNAPAGTEKPTGTIKGNYTATSSKPIEVYNKDKVKIVVNTNTVISVSPSEEANKKGVASINGARGTSPVKPGNQKETIKRNFSAAEINAALKAGKVTTKPETAMLARSGNESKPLNNNSAIKPGGSAGASAIKKDADRFYVIVNGYSTRENAERNQKIIAKKGRPGKIIPPSGNATLYRIAIAEYNTKEQAIKNLPELKKKYGNTIWILKN